MGTKLSDLIPAPEVVEIKGKSVEVNGLSLDNIVYLINRYRDGFAQLLVSRKDDAGNEIGPDYTGILKALPVMSQDIIAMGLGIADDEEERKNIPRLSAMTQVEIILTVWGVTVPDPKKFQSLLWGVLQSLRASQPKNDSSAIENIVASLGNKSPS